jgi:hypothetical protein
MSNRQPAPVVDLAFERAKAEARALLRDHPSLRSARTAAFLTGEGGEEPMARIKQFDHLTLRLPHDLVVRVDDLVPVAGAAPELSVVGTVTRADVLRLALLRGLAVLEAELAPGPEV